MIHQLLALIDKHKIQSSQHFPIFGFNLIQTSLESAEGLKNNQKKKIQNIIESTVDFAAEHQSINSILEDENIPRTKKLSAIILGILYERIDLSSVEEYLRDYPDKKTTNYRKLLCVYDYKKYARQDELLESVSASANQEVNV